MSSIANSEKVTHPGPHWAAGHTPINVGGYTRIKPSINVSQCNGCLFCFLLCPDGAISVQGSDKKPTVDINLCKACGICACECPTKAIEMLPMEEQK